MSNIEAQNAFLALRPVCVALAQNPSESVLSGFERLLKSRSWPSVPELGEYCLFPLIKRLREPRLEESILIGCVRCLSAAVNAFRGALRSKVFHDIQTTLVMFLSSKDDLSTPRVIPRRLSEEEKMELVSCLRELFTNGGSCPAEMLQHARLPALGHTVALLLELAEKEKSRTLRVGSMLALDCVCLSSRALVSDMNLLLASACSGHQFAVRFATDDSVNQACAFSLAHFLPGIASALGKVMKSDEKQGQKVTQAAIYLWTTTVAFVLNDKNHPEARKSKANGNSSNASSAAFPDNTKLPAVAYGTGEWWKRAAVQIHALLKQLASLHSHTQWKVRLFVARMASTLLQHCRRSLSSSVTVLVEMLVALIADGYSDVAQVARTALDEFSRSIDTASVSLVSLLEEGAKSACLSLPSIFRGTDDRQKLSRVLLLQGYFQLLGPHLSKLLTSSKLLQYFFNAVLMALEIDTSRASISISHSRTDGESAVRIPGSHMQRSPLTFKNFQDEAIRKSILLSCSLVGYYGVMHEVIESLFDILLLKPHLHKQIVLVINTLMSGAAGMGLDDVCNLQAQDTDDQDLDELVRVLLTEYTQPRVWHAPTEQPHSDTSQQPSSVTNGMARGGSLHSRLLIVPAAATSSANPASLAEQSSRDEPTGKRRKSQLTVEVMRSNVVLVCLLLDGVRTFAVILGQEYRQFLLKTLFPVLEKAGKDNLLIRDAAYVCLQSMAASCNYRSVGDLIGCNADYLLNLCTSHMQVMQQYEVATRVLCETLSNSNDALLPLLNAFLDEVLSVLDTSVGTGQDIVLVPVLRAAVAAVRRWVPDGEPDKEVVASTDLMSDSSDLAASIPNGNSPAANGSDGSDDSGNEDTSIDDIQSFFLDYHRRKEEEKKEEEAAEAAAAAADGDYDPDADPDQTTMEPDVAKKLSNSDNVGVRVLTYCVNLMSMTNVRSSLLVLDAIEQGLCLLRANSEELLPLVHQLWSPLLHRVQHSHLPIATKAVHIIGLIAAVAGDFVRDRVMKDIIPVFVRVLQQPIPSKYTQLHTLLLGVFSTLSILASKLDLPEKEVVHLSNMCTGYLSCKMPQSIQQAALNLYKQWARTYGDCIWLLLVHLQGSHSTSPPHSSLPPVKLLGTARCISADIRDNVHELLKCV